VLTRQHHLGPGFVPADYLDAITSPLPGSNLHHSRVVPSPLPAFCCCQSRRLSGFARNLLQHPLALLHVNSLSFDSSSQRLIRVDDPRELFALPPLQPSSSCFSSTILDYLASTLRCSTSALCLVYQIEIIFTFLCLIFICCATVVLSRSYCVVLPQSIIAIHSITASSRTRVPNHLDKDRHDCQTKTGLERPAAIPATCRSI